MVVQFIDPTHANGLWNPDAEKMPLYVAIAAGLGAVFLVYLMGVLVYIALKTK